MRASRARVKLPVREVTRRQRSNLPVGATASACPGKRKAACASASGRVTVQHTDGVAGAVMKCAALCLHVRLREGDDETG